MSVCPDWLLTTSLCCGPERREHFCFFHLCLPPSSCKHMASTSRIEGKKSISEFLATLWKLFACDSKQSYYNKMERKKYVRSSVYFCRDVSCISNCAGLQCECVLFLAHLVENRHCSMENVTWMADAPKGREERSHLGMGWPAGRKELVSVSPIAVILPGGWWTFDQYWVLHSTKADSSLASLQSPALESLLAEVTDKKSGCLGQVFSGS